MNEHKLLENKIWAIVFIFLGFLSIFIEYDATFFLFTLFLGIPTFFAKENCILKGGEEDEWDRDEEECYIYKTHGGRKR